MIAEFLSIFVILIILDYLWKRKFNKIMQNIPGPLDLPIFGSIWLHLSSKPDELLKLADFISKKYGRVVKSWVFHINALFVSDPKYIQTVLSHSTEIKKNRMYSLLNEWLGEGLLTSHGPKWLSRRRVITPAFHFQILENFVQIFDQQASIFAHKLNKHAAAKKTTLDEISKSESKYVTDVEHYIALATLDVICETAMGVKINAQTDENCEYVRNLIEMQQIFLERFVKIHFRIDIVFKVFNPKMYKRYKQVMASLHEFTENIIRERRKEMLNNGQSENKGEFDDRNTTEEEEGFIMYGGKKKRMALLDILLSSTIDQQPLTDHDIREEVDTFMFEGHDTTKSGIGFTLYLLSRHQEVQKKFLEELNEIIGPDVTAPLTYTKLMELKYMDKVIKESLRMYPPVPFIGRQLVHDIHVDNQCIPGGTSVLLGIMPMQNDPEYFTDPHKFIPERKESHQNNFVFVPFSAGPRNCIGQRFAMLEMKAVLTRIIQNYELLPLGEDVKPTISIVLKSKNGWQLGFRKRQ
ncbi:cytochrome P450 4d2-like isoform X1 [Haematobia irritans]|uniref:cytochrome P450 4d2-like isoform X1 n=1 Tax=Haematobia irritans TaxID=7368 RepID=UPI003F50BD17